MKKIILVEDDRSQAELNKTLLEGHFQNIQIERISTELDFIESIEAIVENPPDLLIMDMNMCWMTPRKGKDLFPEWYTPNSRKKAGLRCLNLLRDKTDNLCPTIFYSVWTMDELGIESREIPKNTSFIAKSIEMSNLFEKIQSILGECK